MGRPQAHGQGRDVRLPSPSWISACGRALKCGDISTKEDFAGMVYHLSFMLMVVCRQFPEIKAISKGGFLW